MKEKRDLGSQKCTKEQTSGRLGSSDKEFSFVFRSIRNQKRFRREKYDPDLHFRNIIGELFGRGQFSRREIQLDEFVVVRGEMMVAKIVYWLWQVQQTELCPHLCPCPNPRKLWMCQANCKLILIRMKLHKDSN